MVPMLRVDSPSNLEPGSRILPGKLALALPIAASAILYGAAIRLNLEGSPLVRGYSKVMVALYGEALSASRDNVFITKRGEALQLTTSCLYLDLTACSAPWVLLAWKSPIKGLALYALFFLGVQAANLLRIGSTLWLSNRGISWFLAHHIVDVILWYTLFCTAAEIFLRARHLPWGKWLLAFAFMGIAFDLARAFFSLPK
jgi:hypothetical protein